VPEDMRQAVQFTDALFIFNMMFKYIDGQVQANLLQLRKQLGCFVRSSLPWSSLPSAVRSEARTIHHAQYYHDLHSRRIQQSS
jgi:hypothetical protein